MMKKTLYELLEVSPNASAVTIEAAYQLHVSRYDPNLAGNIGREDAAVQLALIKEAYSTLSHPERRAAYDASLRLESMANLYVPDPAQSGAGKSSTLQGRVIGLIVLLVLMAIIAQYAMQYFLVKQAQERQIQILDQVQEQEKGTPGERAEEAKRKEEAARLAQERADERQQRQEEQQRRSEYEQFQREADMNQQQRERAEQEAQRKANAEREAQERKLRQQQQEIEQRVRMEQAERERKLRELEYQHNVR